jgi:hypothetical protein
VYDTIATVVFSHPPIGTIGLTEDQAVAEFGVDAVKTKYARFPSMLYAFNPEVSSGTQTPAHLTHRKCWHLQRACVMRSSKPLTDDWWPRGWADRRTVSRLGSSWY